MNKPKRPEKKLMNSSYYFGKELVYFRDLGYSKACDDWEKFLPDEGEIRHILDQYLIAVKTGAIDGVGQASRALSKRIRGEKDEPIANYIEREL